MSDVDRMYRLLCQRGPRGAHTHELRSMGYSGNPSQRAADIEAKYGVTVERERERRNGRNGSRFKLVGSSAESRKNSADSMRCRGAADSCAASSEKRSVPSMFDVDVSW